MGLTYDPAISCLTVWPKKVTAPMYENYKYKDNHWRIAYDSKKLNTYTCQSGKGR